MSEQREEEELTSVELSIKILDGIRTSIFTPFELLLISQAIKFFW